MRKTFATLLIPCSFLANCAEPPPPELPKNSVEKPALPEVCGTWRSLTSGKKYAFRCRNGTAFVLFQFDPNGLPVRIGDGFQADRQVVAVADFPVETESRSGRLDLTLNPEGTIMVGTLRGIDPREYYFVRFLREDSIDK